MQVVTRRLGMRDYEPCFAEMKRFTEERDAGTADELWLLQHSPVFTLGLSGHTEHILDAGGIPVVHTDRGGQVTYHGPGQLVVYLLLDLKRRGLGARTLVHRLEQAVIDLLEELDVKADRRRGAPGVYVAGAKIAALGIRIRNGCSYHGMALNVDMDLEPFGRINPCGFPGLAVTRLVNLGVELDCEGAGAALVPHLLRRLSVAPAVSSRRGFTGEVDAYNRARP